MPNRRKVLIIDDEIDLCLLLKGYFQRKGFEVTISHNLKEGIELLHQIKPGVLLLDNNLPDGTGWPLAPQLAREHTDMFIVLISAFHPSVPQMPDNTRYMNIEKPISINDLDAQFSGIIS